jgi:hypothetical protein
MTGGADRSQGAGRGDDTPQLELRHGGNSREEGNSREADVWSLIEKRNGLK